MSITFAPNKIDKFVTVSLSINGKDLGAFENNKNICLQTISAQWPPKDNEDTVSFTLLAAHPYEFEHLFVNENGFESFEFKITCRNNGSISSKGTITKWETSFNAGGATYQFSGAVIDMSRKTEDSVNDILSGSEPTSIETDYRVPNLDLEKAMGSSGTVLGMANTFASSATSYDSGNKEGNSNNTVDNIMDRIVKYFWSDYTYKRCNSPTIIDVSNLVIHCANPSKDINERIASVTVGVNKESQFKIQFDVNNKTISLVPGLDSSGKVISVSSGRTFIYNGSPEETGRYPIENWEFNIDNAMTALKGFAYIKENKSSDGRVLYDVDVKNNEKLARKGLTKSEADAYAKQINESEWTSGFKATMTVLNDITLAPAIESDHKQINVLVLDSDYNRHYSSGSYNVMSCSVQVEQGNAVCKYELLGLGGDEYRGKSGSGGDKNKDKKPDKSDKGNKGDKDRKDKKESTNAKPKSELEKYLREDYEIRVPKSCDNSLALLDSGELDNLIDYIYTKLNRNTEDLDVSVFEYLYSKKAVSLIAILIAVANYGVIGLDSSKYDDLKSKDPILYMSDFDGVPFSKYGRGKNPWDYRIGGLGVCHWDSSNLYDFFHKFGLPKGMPVQYEYPKSWNYMAESNNTKYPQLDNKIITLKSKHEHYKGGLDFGTIIKGAYKDNWFDWGSKLLGIYDYMHFQFTLWVSKFWRDCYKSSKTNCLNAVITAARIANSKAALLPSDVSVYTQEDMAAKYDAVKARNQRQMCNVKRAFLLVEQFYKENIPQS